MDEINKIKDHLLRDIYKELNSAERSLKFAGHPDVVGALDRIIHAKKLIIIKNGPIT